MKSLTAAVFDYISVFQDHSERTTPAARAARECAIDRVMAAAFAAVEDMINPSGEAVPEEYLDITLESGLELASILTMMAQDGVNLMSLPENAGVRDCPECLASRVLDEAREYLYPDNSYQTGPDGDTRGSDARCRHRDR